MTTRTQSPEPWPYVEADRDSWPVKADCDDENGKFWQALCDAKLEVRKKRTDEAIARAQAERAVDNAVEQAYYQAVLDLAKGGIDRTHASAETVQKAAAAIVTLYTGLLTVAFAAGSHPLPFRGIFAAIFLGLAVVLSTWFLAYLPDPDKPEVDPAIGTPAGADVNDETVRTYVLWVRKSALSRGYPLRASVLALGVALFFLPTPFVQKGKTQTPAPKVTWPAAPTEPSDPELKKILYTAQVNEAAEAHKTPLADEGNDRFWWIGFAVGLAVVLFVPLIGDFWSGLAFVIGLAILVQVVVTQT